MAKRFFDIGVSTTGVLALENNLTSGCDMVSISVQVTLKGEKG